MDSALRVTRLFFDAPKVIGAVDRAERQVLSKFGAFVRTRARSSIRKRKKPASPGSPPSSHVGTLKRLIFFAYDPRARSVVIGPEKINQAFVGGDGEPVTGTAPAVLEYSGQIKVVEVERRGKWQRVGRVSRRGDSGGTRKRKRTVAVAARPFMNPALEAEMPSLPPMWRDSVRR